MLAPGSSVGRYVIKKRLAEGGMAEVYLAQAIGPEGFVKDVVIKVVRSFLSTDPQFIDMFIAEARLSSRLNHANVVQIFDFGKHEASYYIAMEYVRGTSLFDLRKRCRERGVPFPPTLVAEIGAQVARGLHYAHALTDRGKPLHIVHRDVTPHNVLLSFDGAVKLTDFGIAKASTTHTSPGVLKGKFAYMSPEQARGDVVDARTDTFALGIVLWEMLTGGRLFDGDSELAVLRSVQEAMIPPPHRLNPEVPGELSEIVMRSLARRPQERYASALEMDRSLATFVLRNAKSIEDTSVPLFLRQLFREEIEADDQEKQASAVRTIPNASTGPDELALGDTLSVDRAAQHAEGNRTLPARQSSKPDAPTTDVVRSDAASTLEPSFNPATQRNTPAGKPAGKTEQVPALVPRTDVSPAHRPSGPLFINTDVMKRPAAKTDEWTDPDKPQLTAPNASGFVPVVDNSTIRVSDSVKLEAEQQIAEARAAAGKGDFALQTPPASAPFVDDEASTAPSTPNPSSTRAIATVGVAVGLLMLGGAYWAFGRDTAGKLSADGPRAPSKPEPLAIVGSPVPSLEPAAMGADAGPETSTLKVVSSATETQTNSGGVTDGGSSINLAGSGGNAPGLSKRLKTGQVFLKADPYADVYVDGKKLMELMGTTTHTLSAGNHVIEFRNEKKTQKFPIKIVSGATVDVVFNARGN